jgi:hypothetical protein
MDLKWHDKQATSKGDKTTSEPVVMSVPKTKKRNKKEEDKKELLVERNKVEMVIDNI